MNIILFFIVLIAASVLLYQDAKSQLISIWWLAAFTITIILFSYFNLSIETIKTNIIVNFLILIFISSILALYFFIRHKSLKKTKYLIGKGDVWVVCSLIPFFSEYYFVAWINISAIIAIVVTLIFASSSARIPFVSYLMGVFIIFFIYLNMPDLFLAKI